MVTNGDSLMTLAGVEMNVYDSVFRNNKATEKSNGMKFVNRESSKNIKLKMEKTIFIDDLCQVHLDDGE